MNIAESQIPLFLGADDGPVTQRREPREQVVRAVGYCRFPRTCADQRPRIAFTRDIAPSGLCVRSDVAEPVGSLLRVAVRGVDGAPEGEEIARVVWSRPTADGGHWMGLARLEAGAARAVRVRALRREVSSVEVA